MKIISVIGTPSQEDLQILDDGPMKEVSEIDWNNITI